jgi:hypothetical protein
MIRRNRLRQLLNENKPSLCVRVNTLWPDLVELVGSLGISIDAEDARRASQNQRKSRLRSEAKTARR